MSNDGGMAANGNVAVAKPSNALTHIFYILAGNRHDNIARMCLLGLLKDSFAYEGERLCRMKTKLRINLAIMNAGHPFLNKIFLLKAAAAVN